jgi:hypothetical protein
MTYHRKPKPAPKINPEVEEFLRNTGPQLLNAFLQRYINAHNSRRGNHYDTQPDHSFHSAEQRTYHDRMEDRV